MISIKSHAEIQKMRDSAKIAALAMERMLKAARPGISTKALDAIAYDTIIQAGAKPNFKGYHGFPYTICASVNEEVVHGFPGTRKLREGDILSIDMGAVYHGYHSDMARTIGIGEISEEAQRLIDVTKESFFQGMRNAVAGNHIADISAAIQDYVESCGMEVIRDLIGHGIGQNLHEAPDVPNFVGHKRGCILKPGMTLAVEPMVSLTEQHVRVLDDGWTAVTKDGCLAAHYENTIAITENGEPEILTLFDS